VSNKVSVLVYSRKVGSPVRKAVLVYFAERASDNGEGIWAAKSTIADAIECGRSTVIRTINDFVSEGILSVVGTRKHKNGETVEYAMNLRVIAALPSVKANNELSQDIPVPERDPSRSGTPPVPERDPYPSRSGTQTTIITTNEPPDVIAGAKPTRPSDILSQVASPEAAKSFADYRQKIIRKALTETAAKRLAKSLATITSQGGDPDDALGMAEEKGWQSITPEWYFNELAKSRSSQQRSQSGRQHPGSGEQFTGIVGAAMRSRAAREQGL
jgi:hypothetical protein